MMDDFDILVEIRRDLVKARQNTPSLTAKAALKRVKDHVEYLYTQLVLSKEGPVDLEVDIEEDDHEDDLL